MLVTNLARSGQLSTWLSATNPDIVLMHFGTNDVWSSLPTQTILDAYSTLVSQMRANNPNMTILVAQIIPMDSARSCATCAQGVQALNAAIPAWAASESTAQSPVIVVTSGPDSTLTPTPTTGCTPTLPGTPRSRRTGWRR